jgi:hypothetical protein
LMAVASLYETAPHGFAVSSSGGTAMMEGAGG